MILKQAVAYYHYLWHSVIATYASRSTFVWSFSKQLYLNIAELLTQSDNSLRKRLPARASRYARNKEFRSEASRNPLVTLSPRPARPKPHSVSSLKEPVRRLTTVSMVNGVIANSKCEN